MRSAHRFRGHHPGSFSRPHTVRTYCLPVRCWWVAGGDQRNWGECSVRSEYALQFCVGARRELPASLDVDSRLVPIQSSRPSRLRVAGLASTKPSNGGRTEVANIAE